jgi:hypothetical protein
MIKKIIIGFVGLISFQSGRIAIAEEFQVQKDQTATVHKTNGQQPLVAQINGQPAAVAPITELPSATTDLAAPTAQVAKRNIVIKGTLFEKGTKIPLANVNVFILPYKLKAVTDQSGQFIFNEVPEGDFSFIINLSGYQKLESKDEQSLEDVNYLRKLYLEKVSYSSFETTVVGEKKKIDGSQKTLTQKEFLSMPGANGDPVKAVQNLPGVNRVQSFSSQVVIQGAAPKDTAYDIDGHRIPLVFHFGGMSSVVMPEALEQVDYLSSGYGAYYSRALGGIISLKTDSKEKLSREKKGFFFVDSLKAGGMYEKQIDDSSSILIGGRMSYVGLIIGKVLEKNKDFNLTVAPEFSDFTVIHKKKWNERDEVKTVFVASNDTLGFLFKKPIDEEPAIRGTFKNSTQFYRLIPQWTRKWDEDAKSSLSAAYGTDKIETIFGSNYFNIRSDVLSVRGDWVQKMQPFWTTQLGFDNVYRYSKVVTRVPKVSNEGGVMNPIGSSETVDINVKGSLNDQGLFWKNDLYSGDWTFIPALRWDHFEGTKESLVTPKLEVKNKFSESLELRTAWGLYVQEPEPQEISEDYGNPDVKSPRAEHLAIGFDKDFREGSSEGWKWNLSFFNRKFTKLVIPSSALVTRDGVLTLENVNNNGTGKAYGVETLFKYDSTAWTGWIGYTYSKSTRTSPPKAETLFEYDQTHSLNLIASMPFGNNWTVASRYRYTTGSPYTPVVSGVFDSDSDVYLPIRGKIYSERYNNFSQLDLRFDKKWISDEEIWSVYIDIQNVLNTSNSETIQYSYDYKQKGSISGLPIMPSIGLKGEF